MNQFISHIEREYIVLLAIGLLEAKYRRPEYVLFRLQYKVDEKGQFLLLGHSKEYLAQIL